MKNTAQRAGPPWVQQNKGEAAEKEVTCLLHHGLNTGEHTLWGRAWELPNWRSLMLGYGLSQGEGTGERDWCSAALCWSFAMLNENTKLIGQEMQEGAWLIWWCSHARDVDSQTQSGFPTYAVLSNANNCRLCASYPKLPWLFKTNLVSSSLKLFGSLPCFVTDVLV